MGYNSKYSPKANQGKPGVPKKKVSQNEDWGLNFNRQGSKKGIISGVGGITQNTAN
jgi:hypothetical protein